MKISGTYRQVTLIALDHDAYCSLPLTPAATPEQLVLVYDASVSNFFFGFGPEKDIDLFLAHSRVANRRRKHIAFLFDLPLGLLHKLLYGSQNARNRRSARVGGPILGFVQQAPLGDLVQLRADEEGFSRSYRLRDLKPGDEVDDVLTDPLEQTAIDQIKESGNFKGMIGCCDCGVPGCASQYAWVKDYKCMVLFSVGSGALGRVDLLPFSMEPS